MDSIREIKSETEKAVILKEEKAEAERDKMMI
jgi:hypothetical protein